MDVLPDKAIPRRLDPTVRARLDSIVRVHPDSVQRRFMRSMLGRLEGTLIARLEKVAIAADKREINVLRARARALDAMKQSAGAAAGIGLHLSGLPDWVLTDDQRRDIIGLCEAEAEYFAGFMQDLATEAVRMARVAMYGGLVPNVMWRMWASTLPSHAAIHWRLGVAEHCKDCLDLARGSPYAPPGSGPNPLPTVPRNGDTQCLTNCRCSIETDRPFESSILPEIGVEITAIGGVEVPPTSIAAKVAGQLYQEAVDRYAYYLRLQAAGSTLPDLPNLIAGALSVIKLMALRHSHSVRLTFTEKEAVEPVKDALMLGLRFVPPERLDGISALVVVAISIDKNDRGKVTSVQHNPPSVTLDGSRVYRLDATGRTLIFVENP